MYSRPSPLRFGMPISYGIAVKCFVRRSAHAFPWHRWRRRPMKAPLRGGSQLARFYPRRHLRSGLVSPIQGAPNSVTTSLSCRLSLRMLKLKTGHAFCFDFDLFRHVVLQPKGEMKARIRRQGCRRKNDGGMDKFAWSKFEQHLRWPRRGEAQGCAEYSRLPFVPLRPE